MQTRFPSASPSSRKHSHPVVAWLVVALSVSFFLVPATAQARSLDEALDELAQSLSKQLDGQQVKWIGILQFANLSGGPTERERDLAETLAKKINEIGTVSITKRETAERTARKMGIAVGAHLDGEQAAKLGKKMYADAVLIATIEDQGGGVLELRAEVYSSKGAVNIASARTSAEARQSTENAKPGGPS